MNALYHDDFFRATESALARDVVDAFKEIKRIESMIPVRVELFESSLSLVTFSEPMLLHLIPHLVPAEVTGAPEEGGAGLALVQVAAGARGRQARRGK